MKAQVKKNNHKAQIGNNHTCRWKNKSQTILGLLNAKRPQNV